MCNIKVLCKVVSGDNIYKVLSPKNLFFHFCLFPKFTKMFRILGSGHTFGSLREENLVLIVTGDSAFVCTIFAISRIYLN